MPDKVTVFELSIGISLAFPTFQSLLYRSLPWRKHEASKASSNHSVFCLFVTALLLYNLSVTDTQILLCCLRSSNLKLQINFSIKFDTDEQGLSIQV